jgi:hypothetical protein
MTNGSLIQIRRAGFRVAGKGRGLGLGLLYQDKLARVSRRPEFLGPVLGLAVVGITYPAVNGFGVVAVVLAGTWFGEQVDRRIAARRVAEGGRGVTTQDRTEYHFSGNLGTWQADLAAALTVLGRSVQVTPRGVTVTPPDGGRLTA